VKASFGIYKIVGVQEEKYRGTGRRSHSKKGDPECIFICNPFFKGIFVFSNEIGCSDMVQEEIAN